MSISVGDHVSVDDDKWDHREHFIVKQYTSFPDTTRILVELYCPRSNTNIHLSLASHQLYKVQ